MGFGVTEVHGDAAVDAELRVLGHLFALIPRQRAAQLRGQRRDARRQRDAGLTDLDPELDRTLTPSWIGP